MPINDRDYIRGNHPPTCTCTKCVEKRLQRISRSGKVEKTRRPTPKRRNQPKPHRIPNWLLALLLILSISILGLGANLLTGSSIPFWLLLGFSIIYSIEKWFSQITKRSKAVGELYRFALNLGILSMLGLLIWSGIKLFSGGFHHNPLIGSLIFLAEFVFFIWIWKVIAKNSWRRPSMKLTVFSLLCIFIVFTFAGVQPFSTYKDNFFTNLETPPKELDKTPSAEPSPEEKTYVPLPISEIQKPSSISPSNPQGTFTASLGSGSWVIIFEGNKLTMESGLGRYTWRYELIKEGTAILLTDITTGKVKEKSFKYIEKENCVVLDTMIYWKLYSDLPTSITPEESSILRNPSWNQLLGFLKEDNTDKHPYTFPTFVCEDFARTLQSNAKKAGWRCAFLSVHLEGYPDWFHYGIPSSTDHALNAFETTDRGLVYIDVTRSPGPGPRDQDWIIDVQVGKEYLPKRIFPSGGWLSARSMGTITSIGNLNW